MRYFKFRLDFFFVPSQSFRWNDALYWCLIDKSTITHQNIRYKWICVMNYDYGCVYNFLLFSGENETHRKWMNIHFDGKQSRWANITSTHYHTTYTTHTHERQSFQERRIRDRNEISCERMTVIFTEVMVELSSYVENMEERVKY